MNAATARAVDTPSDYFTERDGLRFAGLHLLADLWDTDRLDDRAHLGAALRAAALAAGATVLQEHFHVFTPQGGVTGVLLLAESHISIHTWPERRFAAVDVFMCAGCDPHRAVDVLRQHLRPGRLELHEQRRGLASAARTL
ncbi:MAG: adenosylmethionine decarboxylase [Rhodoferax sp.]